MPILPPTHTPRQEARRDVRICLRPAAIEDRDGDIQRNIDALSSRSLCLKQDIFQEGTLHWTLQIIRNRIRRGNILWIVPHDNEKSAFDTAVYGVTKYGGTVVAVETGGRRFNGAQDPNRNFDAGTGHTCTHQIAPSPLYTRRVLRWRVGRRKLIVALHTNDRGYSGDGQGGRGEISILRPLAGSYAYPAPAPLPAVSPDDTMVFVASMRSKEHNRKLATFVDKLNRRGINVMYELVSPSGNDCSLSNYAALRNIRGYANVEVVHGDGAGQRRIVDMILGTLGRRPIRPLRGRQ